MNVSFVGELDFDGVLLPASFVGRRSIEGQHYSCYQPSFDDCTLVRCEPDDGSGVLFVKGEDF